MKVDETTVAFEFDEPHFLFPSQLAGDTQVGGGQSRMQSDERELGIVCAGALPQEVPAQVQLGRGGKRSRPRPRATTTGSAFQDQVGLAAQPRCADPAAVEDGPADQLADWVLERNPYYWVVDTAGNQLPYIDKVSSRSRRTPRSSTCAPSPASTTTGALHRLAKLPVFLENAERGKYKVHLDPASRRGLRLIQFAYKLDMSATGHTAPINGNPSGVAGRRPAHATTGSSGSGRQLPRYGRAAAIRRSPTPRGAFTSDAPSSKTPAIRSVSRKG